MVKNSILRNNDDNLIIIQHYETDIFIYNPVTKETKVKLNCSVTSNKMIYRALEFFNVSKYQDINEESKWSYSGEFQN